MASCADAQAQSSDFFGGFVHGILGLFGAGSLVDPLGDAQSSVQAALKDINQTTAAQSLAVAQGTEKEIEELFLNMNQHLDLINQINQNQTDQLWDTVRQENLFLIILSMLIVLLIFFFLIQKKCC